MPSISLLNFSIGFSSQLICLVGENTKKTYSSMAINRTGAEYDKLGVHVLIFHFDRFSSVKDSEDASCT